MRAARRSRLPPLRLPSTETPGGNRSLCFLSWAGRAVWCLDQPCSQGGREDLWAPNLHQCGSGMSNREVGLLPPSAPGNALGKVGGATLCHLADVLVRIFGDGGGSSCVALW